MKRLIAITALILLFSMSTRATTVERLTLDDMVKKAEAIVHGKVTSSRTHWSSNRKLILTTYMLDVSETIKGQAGRSVELTTIGGRIGDLILHVSGMPSFEPDEDAVVFLEKSGAFSTVVGLNQGKFTVRNGEVSNNPRDLSFRDGRGAVPLKMRLDDFKRQIESRLR